MRYIVPSSKIVFTDFMLLLVSVLMGLNSVMSFSEQSKETNLPSVKLPLIVKGSKVGSSTVTKVYVTVKTGENGKKVYFYNQKEVTIWQLIEYIKKATVTTLVLRGDRETIFEWEEFCQLSSKFMRAGVKQISYAINQKGATEK